MKKPIVFLLALVICFAMAGAAAVEDDDFETMGAYEGPYLCQADRTGAETYSY